MLHLNDFDYQLPQDRIAQTPAEPRDHSKLLVVDRETQQFRDCHFFDLAHLLTPNDVLVLNDTKVFPARLFAFKTTKGHLKPIEILLEKEVALTSTTISWDALTKPGLNLGDTCVIPHTTLTGVCTGVQGYTRTIEFSTNRESFFAFLDQWAKTPIPPYIEWNDQDERSLRSHYQTVYAKRTGAMAAPTAGLHFTADLLKKIEHAGVTIATVTLHVGLGTFLPVKMDDVTEHHMHSEWYELTTETATQLNQAKEQGKRIIAVGTTSVRVLETCSQPTSAGPLPYTLQPQTGDTSIYIYPPYKFQYTDSLLTNFHTPKSTLLMLVGALVSSPNHSSRTVPHSLPPFTTFSTSLLGRAYQYALEKQYRFYSFGDSMWII